MRADRRVAVEYLRDSTWLFDFWRWDDRGERLAWSDGTAIAFREEVVRVLERLAPWGLPPFECVVLLLSVCREGWHAPNICPWEESPTSRTGARSTVCWLASSLTTMRLSPSASH